MNKREAAIITAYTGIMLGQFSDFHELAEEILNRPIFTHEFGDRKVADELKEKAKPLFLEIHKQVI
mgnify:CR=1 FL=1